MIIEKNPDNPQNYLITVARNLDLGMEYVARIIESSSLHRFKRDFLTPHTRFKKKTRFLVVTPGYYEIKDYDLTKPKKEHRQYFRFTGTDWEQISRKDLEQAFPLGAMSSYE